MPHSVCKSKHMRCKQHCFCCRLTPNTGSQFIRCPISIDETSLCTQMALASKAKVDSMTNLATVAFKEGNFQDCFKWCDKALR